jgi:hypothetical protein
MTEKIWSNFLVLTVALVLIKIHFKKSENPYKTNSNHTTQTG